MSHDDAEKLDQKPEWSMSQEREFMENLLQQRFNFLIVLFGVVLAGALATKSPLRSAILLAIGGLLCFGLARTVHRAHSKMTIIFSKLESQCDVGNKPTHPYKIIDDLAVGCSARWLIGCFMPYFCASVLMIASAIFFCQHFNRHGDLSRTNGEPRETFRHVPSDSNTESTGQIAGSIGGDIDDHSSKETEHHFKKLWIWFLQGRCWGYIPSTNL